MPASMSGMHPGRRSRLPDDQASIGSYSSEAHTLPGDAADDDDLHSTASHDSFDSCRLDPELPSYRVPKEQGVSQPVYEAWILHPSDANDYVEKTTFCGLNILTRCYADSDPHVSRISPPYGQDELADMVLAAVERYQKQAGGSTPSLVSRLVRGGRRTKPYERDLDERIRELPRAVQSELHGLLADRAAATRNRFHRRDWTVVMMSEQYHYRFASAEYEEVDRKSGRFWGQGRRRMGRSGGGGPRQPIEYLFILRGAEGRVPTDDDGFHQASPHGNPWKRVDEAELAQKQRARDVRRLGKECIQDGWRSRRRDRSPSLPPPRRVRVESNGTESSSPPNPFAPEPRAGGFGMPPPSRLPPPDPGLFSCRPAPPPGALHPYPAPPPIFPHACPCAQVAMNCYPVPPPPPPPPVPGSPPRLGSLFADFDGNFHDTYHVPSPSLPPDSSAPASYPNPFPLGFHGHSPTQPPALVNLNSDGFGLNFPPMAAAAPQYTASSRPSPPPAPRLSNLTTPTTFSPATSDRTGSSVDRTEFLAPAEVDGQEIRQAGPRPGSAPGPSGAAFEVAPPPVFMPWERMEPPPGPLFWNFDQSG